MTKRVCAQQGCVTLVDTTVYKGLCVPCRRGRDRERGSRERRGYDPAHRAERARLVAELEAGRPVLCWRCGGRIESSQDLHLGHDDDDRTITRGAECVRCNLSAAGKKAHRTGSREVLPLLPLLPEPGFKLRRPVAVTATPPGSTEGW